MFAPSFDLDVAEAHKRHPQGSRQAYRDIGKTLGLFGSKRVKWSVYAADREDPTRSFNAIGAWRKPDCMGPSVVDLRAFRMEQASDFTAIVKGAAELAAD
jgi:virulence-associated protein VapD